MIGRKLRFLFKYAFSAHLVKHIIKTLSVHLSVVTRSFVSESSPWSVMYCGFYQPSSIHQVLLPHLPSCQLLRADAWTWSHKDHYFFWEDLQYYKSPLVVMWVTHWPGVQIIRVQARVMEIHNDSDDPFNGGPMSFGPLPPVARERTLEMLIIS